MLSKMRFKGAWRDYQAHVLDEMVAQFADGRLHVVAAPGAGKTVLGLEIVRRLGRPAVVFAPTVAIRDQWAQRICPLFLDEAPGAEHVSRDLEAPRQLTLATYQALDGFRRAEQLDALIAGLNATGPLTLVLDEAHHLRREWWNGLERLASGLADVRLVALTATPPYDASFAEWGRYESLCGPVDLEIGIPELVRNGDLCPHQDHIVLSAPTPDVLQLLDARRRAMGALQQDLREDQELLDLLASHPWLADPEAHVEAILEAPQMLSATLVLLASGGRKPPPAPLRLLGVSARHIPPPSFVWLETFLNGVLGDQAAIFPIGEARRRALRDRLHRDGLIEGKRVRLRQTRAIFRMMASSLAKLDSIAEIAEAEDISLGDRLRMVVLSDHIRAEELPTDPDAPFKPAKMGVVPAFEQLRRAGVADGRIGVLTGTLVIAPRAALGALRSLSPAHGVDPATIRAQALRASPDHVQIDAGGAGAGRLVPLMTDLFTRGEIRLLVGTQSLLGEGWDAPALNSLILASNTASFMLSNQMRGRAIRIDPRDPEKVANIWHLATVEPVQDTLAEGLETLSWGYLNDDELEGLSDAALLGRRFRAFEGIANGDSTLIESGVARLGVDIATDLEVANRRTLAGAADRPDIAQRWARSLGDGTARSRVRETAAPNYAPQVLSRIDTLHALIWGALSAAVFGVGEELYNWSPGAGFTLMGLGSAAFLAAVPNLFRAARLYWRNGTMEGSLEQVGRVVLDALAHAGLVPDPEARGARFDVRATLDGRRDVVLRGVSRGTERLVMQSIAEALGPVENARYLLVRKSRLGWRTRTDFHAVPSVLAGKKAWAEAFAKLWAGRIGRSELVFTRTPAGRRLLLRARAKSFAAGFQRSVDRRSAWL